MAEEGGSPGTWLLSRIFVTWVEVIAIGFLGAALSGAASGPPQLIVYLATVLASVGALLYNVDKLIQHRIAESR